MPDEIKANVKKVLCYQLVVEPSRTCRNLICDALGEIAAGCYEKFSAKAHPVNEFADIK